MNVANFSRARPTKACVIRFQEGEREVWNGYYAPGMALGAWLGSVAGIFLLVPHPIANPYVRVFWLVLWFSYWRGAYRNGIEVWRFFKYAYSLTNYRLIVYNKRKGVVVGEIPLRDIESRKLQKNTQVTERSQLWLIPKEPKSSEKWPFRLWRRPRRARYCRSHFAICADWSTHLS